tara:strand:+ start:692 stop:940 length:249 start_codon:yes stop_codon:yes gene_type:complete
MATGDVTISIAVEGGVTKSIVLDSATRVLARAYSAAEDSNINTDAKWQTREVNRVGNNLVSRANKQQEANLSYTAKTFTKAT